MEIDENLVSSSSLIPGCRHSFAVSYTLEADLYQEEGGSKGLQLRGGRGGSDRRRYPETWSLRIETLDESYFVVQIFYYSSAPSLLR